MYILKGFINIPELISNVKGQTATFGEITTNSLTYAKDVGFYRHADYNQVTLYAFKSTDSQSGDIVIPDDLLTQTLDIAQFVLDKGQDGTLTESSTPDNVTALIVDHVPEEVDTITTGEILNNGSVYLPEWIAFEMPDRDTNVKVWLANESFSKQYDEYEYEFISPIENLDDFYRTYNQVKSLIDSITIKQTLQRIENIRGQYPFTTTITQEYSWSEVNSTGADVPTSWIIVIYGIAGNDPDAIREALIEWILDNSSHTREEWLDIFPGIFTPTEFMIVPLWQQYAIPDQSIQDGLNSPTVRLSRALEIAKELFIGVGYEDKYLMDNVTVAQSPYKTLAFLAGGSNANRNGVTNFRHLFPDYVGVSVQSNEFSRLSDRTQGWMRLMVNALQIASEMTTISQIPDGYSRVVREGVVYAVIDYDDMQYLIATKGSVIDTLGTEAPYDRSQDETDQ